MVWLRKKVERVVNTITAYFFEDPMLCFSTDVGTWGLEITNTEGEVLKFTGSFDSDMCYDDVNLSEMVRNEFGMDDGNEGEGEYEF